LDEIELTRLAEAALIDIRPASQEDGRVNDVWVDGQDVTWEIRQPDVDALVSMVSVVPGVRKALSLQQRRIGLRGRVVMVGRDIGTVVLPEAELKIFLDASLEERARRRFREQQMREGRSSYEEILDNLRERDRIDSTRSTAPLCKAEDAVVIDSDNMPVDQVIARIKSLW
jgi:cytidylate kinase